MLKENEIYNDDCLKLMKRIPDESIDVVVTDPPYGIKLTPQRKGGKFKNTVVKNDDNLDWLPELSNELYRVLKNNAACYVFCNWQSYDIFKQAFEKKFTIKNCIVWNKDWFGMGNNWRPNHEFILLATKGNFKTKSKNKSNILTHRRLHSSKMLHSCEKPLPLLEELIVESCNENDLILDCYCGSASTIEACLNTNRKFIGIEIDEDYFKIAKKRIAEYTKAIEV